MGLTEAAETPRAFGLASIGAAGTAAVLREGRFVRLADLADGSGVPPMTVMGLLSGWDTWVDWITDRVDDVEGSRWRSLDQLDEALRPAVPAPPTVYCAGANYHDHVAAMSPGRSFDPISPYHFIVSAQSLAADGEAVVRPAGCRSLDWEVELAAVIGRRAHDVHAEEALDFVAGYTIANDISARDLFIRADDQPFEMDWIQHKSHETFLPLGPMIVPRRFVVDPQALRLSLTVDGQVMQDSSTSKMVFSVAEQISALSRVLPLVPGDVVCTGTPAGTGHERGLYLKPGDEMVASIEGLGSLRNTVVSAE